MRRELHHPSPDRVQISSSGSHSSNDVVDPIETAAPVPLSVQYLAGRGTRLVVSFAGVGKSRKQTPPREFVGSASGGGENHVLFISDQSRSWMNGPGVADAILRPVTSYCEANGITEVVALGNSMGGFSAIVLADLMPIRTVIALSPQFSVHPDLVPEENRWGYHRQRIDHWTFRDVGALDQSRTQYFIFHGDAHQEAVHWARFPDHSQLHHFIVLGEGHRLAFALRKRKVLRRIVKAMIAGKSRRVRLALQRGSVDPQLGALRRRDYEQR